MQLRAVEANGGHRRCVCLAIITALDGQRSDRGFSIELPRIGYKPTLRVLLHLFSQQLLVSEKTEETAVGVRFLVSISFVKD